MFNKMWQWAFTKTPVGKLLKRRKRLIGLILTAVGVSLAAFCDIAAIFSDVEQLAEACALGKEYWHWLGGAVAAGGGAIWGVGEIDAIFDDKKRDKQLEIYRAALLEKDTKKRVALVESAP